MSGCEVRECGTSGVLLGGGDRKTLTPACSTVDSCRIHDFGILRRTYAGGVHLEGCGLAVRGCEIFNAPHTAVFFSCNDSVLESNDVHHVLLETGDAGAFYTGRDWTTQGNVLRYNFVHDLGTGTTAREGEDAAVSGTNAMGMYFDDCDCGAIIDVREMFRYNDNGTVPGIFSRMAPMRDNTVIYTKDAKALAHQKFDPRIADGFRVIDTKK